MATWSLKATGLPGSGTRCVGILDSGGVRKAYIWGSDGYVYEFNAATDTITQIADSSSWGGSSMSTSLTFNAGPVVFGGEVYAVVHDAADTNAGVWKWDGTGVSWTKVLNTNNGQIMQLARTENHLVAWRYPDLDFSIGIHKYSTDGTTWNDANSSDNIPPSLTPDYDITWNHYGEHSLGLWNSDYSDDVLSGPSTTQLDRLFQWSESNAKWEIKYYEDDLGGTPTAWVSEYYAFSTYHWRFSFGGSTWEWSSDLSSWTAPTDQNIEPVGSVGFSDVPIEYGYYDSPSFAVYQLVDGDWDSGETDFTGLGTNPVLRMAFRFSSDGSTYLIIDSDDGLEIWGRSEAILGTTVANFYHGIDTLTQKATLAITEPGPHGMAVNEQGEVVVVSGEAGATMSERLTNADDYATTEDYTNGLDITEGLNVVRYI